VEKNALPISVGLPFVVKWAGALGGESVMRDEFRMVEYGVRDAVSQICSLPRRGRAEGGLSFLCACLLFLSFGKWLSKKYLVLARSSGIVGRSGKVRPAQKQSSWKGDQGKKESAVSDWRLLAL
jgi:hypothetical protein